MKSNTTNSGFGLALAFGAFLSVFSVSAPAFAALGDCGQPQSTGTGPKTADALAALKTAVASDSKCDETPCTCDVDANGTVTTTDALKILRKAVAQPVELDCDCEGQCLTFGEDPLAATTPLPWPRLDLREKQVVIDSKFIEISTETLDQFEFDWTSTNIVTDSGPRLGGINGAGQHVAVSSSAAGGAAGVDYFVHAMQPRDGALSILNKNFVSPFQGLKLVPSLPTTQCVLFESSATETVTGYPNKGPAGNLAPFDAGFGGGKLFHQTLGTTAASSLLTAFEDDPDTLVLGLMNTRARSGQSLSFMVNDFVVTKDKVESDFRTKITDVTTDPFGIFTGLGLEVTPHITDSGDVALEIRPGLRMLTFFLSTAFMVGGVQVDAEIPVRKPSRNVVTVVVPSGMTLVLAGLQKSGQQEPGKGLPILNDVPLLGPLFSRNYKDATTHNLVVFLTPTVIGDD